jgi:hypothetical protein
LSDEVGLGWWALLNLRDDGWLSFDPESTPKLNEAEEAELRFLAALVTAGCDPAMLRNLLSNLEKPYSYKITKVYFDWSQRRWLLLPERAIKPAAAFSEWLDGLKERGDLETLQEAAREIEAALADLKMDEPGARTE